MSKVVNHVHVHLHIQRRQKPLLKDDGERERVQSHLVSSDTVE